MQKGFSSIVILTTALLMTTILSSVIWYYFEYRKPQASYTAEQAPQQSQQVSVDQINIHTPNNWQQYTDVGINFTFAHPQNAEVYRIEEKTTIILKTTQQNSATLSITSLPLNGRTFSELVEQKSEIFEFEPQTQVEKIEDIKINEKKGTKITTQSTSGIQERIYLPRGIDMYYETTTNISIQDEEKWQVVRQILSTLKEE